MIIAALKRNARQAYQAFMLELAGYDCGMEMLKTVNPRAAQAAMEYNEAMAALKLRDPSCLDFQPL